MMADIRVIARSTRLLLEGASQLLIIPFEALKLDAGWQSYTERCSESRKSDMLMGRVKRKRHYTQNKGRSLTIYS